MQNDMINRIQTKWGKFSKHQIENMKGDLDELVGMIQNAYGCSRNRAEREYHDFQLTLRPNMQPFGTKPFTQGR